MIIGSRMDSQLMWVPEERHLYHRKRETSNGVEWTCYQNILVKGKKDAIKCTSSVIVNGKTCTRKNIQNEHTKHGDHTKKYNDLISANNIKTDCIKLSQMCKGLSISVPAYDIFTREMAK